MADDNRWRDEDRSRHDDDRYRQSGPAGYGSQGYGQGGWQGSNQGAWQGQQGYGAPSSHQGGYGQGYGQPQSYGRQESYGQGYGQQDQGRGGMGWAGWGGQNGMSGMQQNYGQHMGAGEPLPYQPGQGYAQQPQGYSQHQGALGQNQPGGGAWDRSTGFAGGQSGGAYTGQTGTGYGRTYGASEGQGQHQGWMERARESVGGLFGGGEHGRHGGHRGRGPMNYSRSDERIRDDVNDRLTDDPFLDASDVMVMVDKGEVTLSGTVGSRDDKRRAEDLADNVSGVKHVQNNLRVGRVGDRSSSGEESGSGLFGDKHMSGTGQVG